MEWKVLQIMILLSNIESQYQLKLDFIFLPDSASLIPRILLTFYNNIIIRTFACYFLTFSCTPIETFVIIKKN